MTIDTHPTKLSTTRLPQRFWRQWSASLISNLGDGVNFVAMPLLALALTDDERLLALTTFATFLPWIVVALPVGVLVDRADRQRLLVMANLVRVVLFGLVAWGALSGWLSIALLIALLLLIGASEVVFDSTAQAFLPSLVEAEQLARANGLLFTAEVIAGSIAGLSLGALLFDASHGLPFAVNAASFAIAAALIASIRTRRVDARAATAGDDAESASVGDAGPAAGLIGSLTWLSNHRLLRTLAAMFLVTNLGLMFGQGIFVKYARDLLGLEELGFGILLAVTALGAASGGLMGGRMVSTFGLRASIVLPYLVFGPAQVLMGLAPSVWIVAVAGFLLGAAITVWNVVTVTVRQQVIPTELFGRVNGMYRWLGAAASATGVVAGGFVAYATDLSVPFILGGAITIAAGLAFGAPVLRGLSAELSPAT